MNRNFYISVLNGESPESKLTKIEEKRFYDRFSILVEVYEIKNCALNTDSCLLVNDTTHNYKYTNNLLRFLYEKTSPSLQHKILLLMVAYVGGRIGFHTPDKIFGMLIKSVTSYRNKNKLESLQAGEQVLNDFGEVTKKQYDFKFDKNKEMK